MVDPPPQPAGPTRQDEPAPVLRDPSDSSEWLPEELVAAEDDESGLPPADPMRWVPQALR